MDDPSGLLAALAIEAVEWEPVSGQNLIIRVRGRWRRRRPALRGQPMLVIEAGGQRHRFPATPEPPSLAGAPPGSWQMTFSVSSELAPHLAGRTWLQLGMAVVPLPPPSGPLPPGEPAELDPEILADRRVRTAEIAAQRERERRAAAEATVGDLTARIESLEDELAAARRDADHQRQLAGDHQRARRSAEQREHAEHALRIELEEELERQAADGRSARDTLADLASSEERIRQLEAERDRLLARLDDAERLAAESAAALVSVAAPVAASGGPRLDPELRLMHGLAPAPAKRAPATRPPTASELRALERERELVREATGTAADMKLSPGVAAQLEQTIVALREELEARTAAEARLRAELARSPAAAAQAPHEADVAPELATILGELKLELLGLREMLERESSEREAAEARVSELERELREHAMRSARVYDALAELRGLLEAVRSERRARETGAGAERETGAGAEREAGAGAEREAQAQPGAVPPSPAQREPTLSTVEAERLDAARTRLRESVSPPEEAAGEPAVERSLRPWLEAPFRALASHDPDTAGRLLIGLLPAQALARPEPIAYDLKLANDAYVRVTVAGEPPATTVTRASEPRPRDQLEFLVEGDPAALARAVAARGLRRRFGRRMARVEGRRREFDAIRAVIRLRRGLDQLADAGVRLDPELTFTLVAWTIDPKWTAGERFSIAHTEGGGAPATYLHIRRGERATVGTATPLWDVAATIVCPDDLLLGALAGRRGPGIVVQGADSTLAMLTAWLDHAQWR